MPVYEYRCSVCTEIFERLTNVEARNDAVACPRCRSLQIRRLFTTFATPAGSEGAAELAGGSCCGAGCGCGR